MWWTRIFEPRDARIERAPVSGGCGAMPREGSNFLISLFVKAQLRGSLKVGRLTTARGRGRAAQDG
jgi:hypothetical protein